MSMADWRELSARWRSYGCIKLADDMDALLDRMEAVEEWALAHVEGDGLRKVLWPAKSR